MLQKSPMHKLGFRPKEELAGGVVYECAEGTACFLYAMPNAGTSKQNHVFTGGGAKEAWFRDSEGNIMAVIQTA
jgi:hypothetical protein